MAGIKNIYQQFGSNPLTAPIEGSNIFERDLQLKMRQYTPFCQFCGGEIIDSPVDEFGMKVDPAWERENQAHYRCLRKHHGQ